MGATEFSCEGCSKKKESDKQKEWRAQDLKCVTVARKVMSAATFKFHTNLDMCWTSFREELAYVMFHCSPVGAFAKCTVLWITLMISCSEVQGTVFKPGSRDIALAS